LFVIFKEKLVDGRAKVAEEEKQMIRDGWTEIKLYR